MNTNYNRRSFLKLSGGILAASGLCNLSLLRASSNSSASDKPIGLQLWSIRDVLPSAPQDILRQVASFGYELIESYEGPQGMFWGMGSKGFKTYLDELGMQMISSHVGKFNKFESFAKKAEEAASIGAKYLICPSAKRKSLDEFKALADDFNRAGQIAKDAGLRFAYHNHAYSYETIDGVFPQDILLERTDPALVDFEMDIYWVAVAKQDPAAWLARYPGRYTLCHIKDKSLNQPPKSTTLGRGTIDWAKLLPQARSLGMKHFIVEQEQYIGTTPLEAAKDNAAYLSPLQF